MPLADDLGIDDVEHVVRNVFGMEGDVLGNGEMRILCPVHETDGLDHSPSCDVNLRTGQWHCFSCSASSDIVGLGKIVLGKPRKVILGLLRPNEPSAIAAAVKNRVKAKQRNLALSDPFYSAEMAAGSGIAIPPLGSYEDGPLDSILSRGFTKKTLRAWGLRFVPEIELVKANGDTFSIRNNIAIPIVGMKGKPVAWSYRATADSDNWQIEHAKYVNTAGLNEVMNRNWFGLYQNKSESEIAVVEGQLDAMWLWQNGIPAVAMMGTSTKQFGKTSALTRFKRVTILPDRDGPGLIAALKLGDRLQSFGTPVKIALYRAWMTNAKGEQASDPQELCPLDLELAHATAVPWTTWRRQPGVKQLADEIRRREEGKEIGSKQSRK